MVLVLGAGSIGAASGLKLEHFAAMRWADLVVCDEHSRFSAVPMGGKLVVRELRPERRRR